MPNDTFQPDSRGTGSAVEARTAVAKHDLMHHVEQIAQWVRLSGDDGESKAFDYIESRLKEWGVKYERYTHPAFISLPGAAKLKVEFRRGEQEAGTASTSATVAVEFHCITHSMGATTPEGGVTAQVVDVGAGDDADYETSKFTAGSIALVRGLAAPPKALTAARHGAAGVICINGDELHEMIVSPVWGSPSSETVHRLPNLPIVSILGRDGESILEALGDGPVTATMEAEVQTEWREIPQLIAEVEGSSYPDEVVFLGGHVDSWHYGAMDNGSANALQLEALRIFQQNRTQLARTFRVGFWSGHSHGRYAGSTWYVDHHFQELEQRMVLHVYVDSIGGQGATVLSEAWAMSETKQVASDVLARETGEIFNGGRFARGGDQSFYGVGVSCLFMCLSEQPPAEQSGSGAKYNVSALLGGNGKTGGLGPWWHAVDDTPDKLDPDFLLRDARIYLDALSQYLEQPRLNLDFRATALELRTHLEHWQEEAGAWFDLSDPLNACDRLAGVVNQFYEANLPTSEFNQVAVGLSRRLVPLNYSSGNRFDHDPALTLPPIPALAPLSELSQVEPHSDEERHLQVLLQRRSNYVVMTLHEAAAYVEGFLR